MPEGHTLRRLANRLDAALAGQRIVATSPAGRLWEVARHLDGRTLISADAWGKNLVVTFEPETHLHVHLGIDGSAGVRPDGPSRARVLLRMSGEPAAFELRRAKQVRALTALGVRQMVARLGPDPLRADADPERGRAAFAADPRPLHEVVLDQSAIAGIGNIYRAETLHRIGVDPFRAAASLTPQEYDALWVAASELLTLGVARPDGPYATYRRTGQPCPRCRALIKSSREAGRTLFWCPGCQHP